MKKKAQERRSRVVLYLGQASSLVLSHISPFSRGPRDKRCKARLLPLPPPQSRYRRSDKGREKQAQKQTKHARKRRRNREGRGDTTRHYMTGSLLRLLRYLRQFRSREHSGSKRTIRKRTMRGLPTWAMEMAECLTQREVSDSSSCHFNIW